MELPLITTRLTMRAWTPEDVDAAFELLGSDATMGRMRAGRCHSREDAAEWIALRIAQQSQWGLTMFAVERRDAPGLVGACGLFPNDLGLELGYIVDHRHVGQGYATEAAVAVCATARAEFLDARIYATIRPHNVASIRVAEHVGFRLTSGTSDNTGPLLVYDL